MPKGVRRVSGRVAADGNACRQINEADRRELPDVWASNRNDVTEFGCILVVTRAEMSGKMQ